jgi:autotransporter translocation and assembly factor TamB
MKNLVVFCLAGFLLASAALAADASGTWSGPMPTRDGDSRDVTFKLKQDGGALTGTMSAFDNDIAIKDGKVAVDAISFTVTLEFNGDSFKIAFTGTLKDNELKMTREREGSGNKQTFTLKRAA